MAEMLKNVAIVGASGNLGIETLKALLKGGKHHVTIITRPSSTFQYPDGVDVRKGEYDDAEFMVSVLRGQDVVISMLGFAGLVYQDAIFEAAAKAGVKYVLPAEYGMDSGNEETAKAVEIIQDKRDIHARIEELGLRWVGVVTGPWVEYGLRYGTFDINVVERKATLYIDSAPLIMCTLPQIGAGIAAMLSLPESTLEEKFANRHLYLSSFRLTQPELFSAVLRVTHTTEDDWTIERNTAQGLVDEGRRMVAEGEAIGHFKIVFGVQYQRDMGGNYSHLLHNAMLGLESEDLDKAVQVGVDAARPGPWEAATTLPKSM